MCNIQPTYKANLPVNHQNLLMVREADIERIRTSRCRVMKSNFDVSRRLVIPHHVERGPCFVLMRVRGGFDAVIQQHPHIHPTHIDRVIQQLAQATAVPGLSPSGQLRVEIHLPVGDEDEFFRAADRLGHCMHGRAPVGVGLHRVAMPYRGELAIRRRVVVTAGGTYLAGLAGQRVARNRTGGGEAAGRRGPTQGPARRCSRPPARRCLTHVWGSRPG